MNYSFDQAYYTGTIMEVVTQYLSNNRNRYGSDFCRMFIDEHNINNGPATHNNAMNLFNFVANVMMNLNGSLQASPEQLFQIVSQYVEEICRIHTQNTQRQQPSGFGAGGFGRSTFGQPNSGFGQQPNGFGRPGGFGSGGFNQRSSPRDDSLAPLAKPQPQSAPQPQAAAPVIATPIQAPAAQDYTINPLDDIASHKDGVDLHTVDSAFNWGANSPGDDSIAIMYNSTYKSADHRYVIHDMKGYYRAYVNNETDVVDAFFKAVPKELLAENFIFELFYNNVEEIGIPTKDFLEIQDIFLKAMERESTAYKAVIKVLETMVHRPRVAITTYLVREINRVLYKCCRMSDNLGFTIKFSQIEDLDDLLGPEFSHAILDIPNARTSIQDIVNNAIKAALSGYSAPMFVTRKDPMIPDIIRTSPAFPFSMDGVYPTKTIIPSYGDSTYDQFYDALDQKVLAEKTFVRSVRSIVVTNTMGRNELSKIGDGATRVHGFIAGLLSSYRTEYRGSIGISRNETSYLDETFLNDIPEKDYTDYLADPRKYAGQMISRFSENDAPRYPVDRTIYAIQFKKSPTEYIKALDVINTINEPRERTSAVFAPKKITHLNFVK